MSIDLLIRHIRCGKCGIFFGITREFEVDRRNDHKIFCCPAAHPNFFPGESEVEKLKAELKRKQEYIERQTRNLNCLRASRNSLKGQVTKLRKQIDRQRADTAFLEPSRKRKAR